MLLGCPSHKEWVDNYVPLVIQVLSSTSSLTVTLAFIQQAETRVTFLYQAKSDTSMYQSSSKLEWMVLHK